MKNELKQYEAFDQNFIPDCLFPSDNELEIPTLRMDMQATTVDIPFVCFGEQRRTFSMNGMGTLHFYTEDYRFNAIYEHPEKILAHNPRNIVEPNFSMFNETPIAFGLRDVYKKRFIARAVQDRGIRVFVDLNVAPKFYKLNLIGVPPGWSSFCTRGYSDRVNLLYFEHEVAKRIAGGNPLTFVCYGGGEICKQYCRENGLIYVTPVIAIKNKIKAIKALKDVIVFDAEHLLQVEPAKRLFDNQIENFAQTLMIEK